MIEVTTQEHLQSICAEAAKHPFVTLDTEFLREKTYFSKLCLIQLSYPTLPEGDTVLIDPIAHQFDFTPLRKLFTDQSVMKVFHAARQDIEIFWAELGAMPEPFYDTQIAAMVCGFGDQVGYETLVHRLTKETLDKSARFTDWSLRPLSDPQKTYAAADVTHLRTIYEKLNERIHEMKREDWLIEEMAELTNPNLYANDPKDAWKKIKLRNIKGRSLAATIRLAEFRDQLAQTRDVPRARIFKDEALLELASTRPKNIEALQKSRLLTRDARKGDIAAGILNALAKAKQDAPEDLPKIATKPLNPQRNDALVELLRVYLKLTCENEDVAPRLIASIKDLEAFAANTPDCPFLKGWRYEIFGKGAEKLRDGKAALGVDRNKVVVLERPS